MEKCPFFGKCGGCALQGLSEADYRRHKEEMIEKALAFQGLETQILPMILLPAHTRRRVTFAYQNKTIGLNAAKSHQIICVDSCLCLQKNLEALILPLRALFRQVDGTGDIAVLMTPFGADIAVIPQKQVVKRYHKKTKKGLDIGFLESVAAFCSQNEIARFTYDGDILFQQVQLPFSPDTFMQPSVIGEETLVRLVLQAVKGAHNVLDLFCGQGTFTRPLHATGYTVQGLDITPEAIETLISQGVSAAVQDLFRNPVLCAKLNNYDAVLLDPARAGAAAQCFELAKSLVPKIIMVSCNPNTFARDAKTLIDGGYRLLSVQPVDQFIFTNHIECVGVFEK